MLNVFLKIHNISEHEILQQKQFSLRSMFDAKSFVFDDRGGIRVSKKEIDYPAEIGERLRTRWLAWLYLWHKGVLRIYRQVSVRGEDDVTAEGDRMCTEAVSDGTRC